MEDQTNVTVIEVIPQDAGGGEEGSGNEGSLTDGDFEDSDPGLHSEEEEDTVMLRDKRGMMDSSRLAKNSDDEVFGPKIITNNGEEISIVGILGKDHDKAEARLAARRQARAEAREIRMRELERQQKEQEQNADRVFDMYSAGGNATTSPLTNGLSRPTRVSVTTPVSGVGAGAGTGRLGSSNAGYHSSRRSSEDSLEEMGSIRDIRHELKEVEEKFRKAMILNAQLDNDKASFSYQLELLKDKLEELQEQHTQLQREHKDKCRSHDALSRECRSAREEVQRCMAGVELRDRCIQEAGLQLVLGEGQGDGEGPAACLQDAHGEAALDVRLRTLSSERQALETEVRQLKAQLEEERSAKKKGGSVSRASHNGPDNASDSDSDSIETMRENSKLLGDYKFRASKAEQDVLTLQATVARLESQVIRYKSAVEEAERMEDELKCDRRKLQREHREAQSRVEELETENSHLNKRLDKLKTAKSALLKEL